MLSSIAALYAKTGKPESYGFFVSALQSGYIQGFDKIGALNAFTFYLSKQEVPMQQQALDIYKQEFASGGMYVKMFAPQYVTYLKIHWEIASQNYKTKSRKQKHPETPMQQILPAANALKPKRCNWNTKSY